LDNTIIVALIVTGASVLGDVIMLIGVIMNSRSRRATLIINSTSSGP